MNHNPPTDETPTDFPVRGLVAALLAPGGPDLDAEFHFWNLVGAMDPQEAFRALLGLTVEFAQANTPTTCSPQLAWIDQMMPDPGPADEENDSPCQRL